MDNILTVKIKKSFQHVLEVSPADWLGKDTARTCPQELTETSVVTKFHEGHIILVNLLRVE